MNRSWIFLPAAAVLLAMPTFGTTCVAGKEFKVRQVCGIVVDLAGATMPDLSVQLLGPDSSVVQSVQTNSEGEFLFDSIGNGNYVLRVKVTGFATAQQPFRVRRSMRAPVCRNPMRVTMQLAGSCSSVEPGR